MKTIKQVAEEIGVSKQAIFYRIKKPPLSNDLQSLLSKIDGVFMVALDGEELIKQAFREKTVKEFADKEPPKKHDDYTVVINSLQNELVAKNEQIKELQFGNRELTQALENTTEALKASQMLHAGTMHKTLLPEKTERSKKNILEIFKWRKLG